MMNPLRIAVSLCVSSFVISGWSSSTEAAAPEGIAHRQYGMDLALFSLVPDQGIDTFRSHGSGSASVNSTVGLVVAENGRGFDVDIKPGLKSQRFVTTITVEPDENDTRTKARSYQFDLSDLRPRAVEIARDEDGRIYQLNLMPRVTEFPQAKPFDVSNLRLHSWSFPSSPVILNDQDYLGRLSMSYGQLAWFDVPGLARVEFSLVRLKGALPWGILDDGTLDITHPDGTNFRISNVLNGIHRQTLAGGPYQVWVRWSEPTNTVEEHRRLLTDRIETLKQRAAEGDESVRSDVIERLETWSQTDRPLLISNGVRGLRPDEKIPGE